MCTTVQVPLPAYAAKIAGWLFASPPVWNRVTTTYSTCPTSSSAADRRSNGLNVLLFMTMLLVRFTGRRPPDTCWTASETSPQVGSPRPCSAGRPVMPLLNPSSRRCAPEPGNLAVQSACARNSEHLAQFAGRLYWGVEKVANERLPRAFAWTALGTPWPTTPLGP